MSSTQYRQSVEKHLAELEDFLQRFFDLASKGDVRAQVLALIPAFKTLRRIGTNVVGGGETIAGARDRILAYLKMHVGQPIDSDELMVVSGISEFARRIRELRVEFGWPIISGVSVKEMIDGGDWGTMTAQYSDLKVSQYVLLSGENDREAAYRWNSLNDLRKRGDINSVKERLLLYLLDNVGKLIPGDELAYLANGKKEWARRTRELRTEDGWQVKTKMSGRSDLPAGYYVLESNIQAEPHDRMIEDSIRIEVLERDNFSCRKCGWSYASAKVGDRRSLLELHHIQYHAEKGKNTIENLITLCNVHHDEVHRQKMNEITLFEWLSSKK